MYALIHSMLIVSGAYGDTLTIEGTGFMTTASENMVKIGSAYCDVTDASATELTCTLGSGTLGTYG